jgi:O-antigen/teichoic acid export membrane protein
MGAIGRVRALLEGSFIRAVGILVGGTVIAQIILALTLPIATRLYSPDQFGTLAVFTGIVSILSVATCLRYDVAVPLPERDEDAVAMVLLAVAIAGAINTLILLATWLVPGWIALALVHTELVPYLWLVPVATFLAGAYSTMQFWFVRNKQFSQLARNRIAQAAGSATTQVGFGLLGIAPLGLLLGQVVNSGLGAVGLSARFITQQLPLIAQIKASDLERVGHEYRRFPQYSALEAMCNSAAIYLPIIMLSAWSTGAEAGYLLLGMYAMQMPMSLIGNAMSQVYMSRGAQEARAGTLGRFTIDVLVGLIKTGVGPIICVSIAAPGLFELVFGNDWIRAGVLVGWMCPWFVMQFLASPVSLALHINGRLVEALGLQVFGLLLRTGTVILALALPNEPLSEAYALSGFVFYLIYILLIVRTTGARIADLMQPALQALPIVFGWILLGLFAAATLTQIKGLIV